MRRTKVAQIYKKTGNLRAVQLLLAHTKLESTVRDLGITVDITPKLPCHIICTSWRTISPITAQGTPRTPTLALGFGHSSHQQTFAQRFNSLEDDRTFIL